MSSETPSIGRYGVFSGLAWQEAGVRAEAAAELEELGFGTIWLGNSGVEKAADIVGATSRIVVGTSIQSIWHHDAADTAERYAELEAAHPGRFLLGLGVSHPEATDVYQRPYGAMVAYLDALDRAPAPVPQGRRLLAALGPRMLGLARDRAAGALPYLVTAEQVAASREVLGEGPLLVPELGVVLETDPERARTLARGGLKLYLGLRNYVNNWLRGGFTEDDLAGGGSDRLIDALFAWGDEERIRARVEDFQAAGADQVALQAITVSGFDLPREEWRRLAEILR
ncbi:LLM class F420-dependent oxidoreductase [Streptosporangium amethystogenes]|uniref:LLM class F420-dependent oxidoreductase n=1 Tax=Streptosporangium amethystogenes TaxID=2002 RepID=UPI003793AFF4